MISGGCASCPVQRSDGWRNRIRTPRSLSGTTSIRRRQQLVEMVCHQLGICQPLRNLVRGLSHQLHTLREVVILVKGSTAVVASVPHIAEQTHLVMLAMWVASHESVNRSRKEEQNACSRSVLRDSGVSSVSCRLAAACVRGLHSIRRAVRGLLISCEMVRRFDPPASWFRSLPMISRLQRPARPAVRLQGRCFR